MFRSILIVALGFAAASAFSVEESFTIQRAKAWLAAHQMPESDEMDVLRAADPKAYNVVAQLINKQQLGLLNPARPMGDKPFATLSADQAAQFKRTKADDDRHNVMSLEAKMMAERSRWSASQSSESTVLSKKLDGEIVKTPVFQPRPSFRPRSQPHRRYVPSEAEIEGEGNSHRDEKSRSHLGDQVSWGSMKLLTKAVKKGKVYMAPSKSWGDIIKSMNADKKKTEAKPEQRQNALADFSWNDDSDDKPQLSMVSKTKIVMPKMIGEMPDNLKHFLGKDKDDDDDSFPTIETPKKTDDNSYMSDLN